MSYKSKIKRILKFFLIGFEIIVALVVALGIWVYTLRFSGPDAMEMSDYHPFRSPEAKEKYLELYAEILKKIDNESVAVTLLTEISKDRRAEQARNERQTKNNDTVTFRQKKCMQNLGIDIPENITRKEASVLIQEEIERLNGVGE